MPQPGPAFRRRTSLRRTSRRRTCRSRTSRWRMCRQRMCRRPCTTRGCRFGGFERLSGRNDLASVVYLVRPVGDTGGPRCRIVLALGALRGGFLQIRGDLFGEDRRIAAVGLRRLRAAATKAGKQAAGRGLLFAAAEHRNGQRPNVRRGGDDAQRRGERRIVLRGQQRRHQHHVGDARSQCVEGAFGGVADDELRADVVPDDRRKTRGLFVVRFDGQDDRHLVQHRG